ncbi:MAG: siderophore-interacting protein, partial [Caulobacterales bacterium]|nr:siderophore-interacting protein [Caulobacterales bacterium]
MDAGPQGPKPADKPRPRVAHVARSERLSPNMQRVVLTGDDLVGFPTDRNGANIKLFFPAPGQGDDALRAAMASKSRPPTRTYTVRDYRADANELDVDFVIHSEGGPASRWAVSCRPGDIIGL